MAFTAGVAASIAANITAAHPSTGARAVAAWPAIALLLVVELMTRKGRSEAPVDHGTGQMPPQAPPAMPAASVTPSDGTAGAHGTVDATGDDLSAVRLPVQRMSPRSLTTRGKVERAAARMPEATAAQIAAKAGVSESTARRYLPKGDATMASPSAAPSAEMTGRADQEPMFSAAR